MKTTLVIIFNHRFDRNLPVLREMYADRFDAVRFLVPFYDGVDPDVVPVSYGSHEFQGFVWNALPELIRLQSDWYVFAGDDLILNPSLDGSVIPERLGLAEGESYIKEMIPVDQLSYTWIHTLSAIDALRNKAMNWEEFLPSPKDAFRRAEEQGYRFGSLGWRMLRPFRFRDLGDVRQFARTVRFLLRKRHWRDLPYPLFKAYADFYVVPGAALPLFARICGVLAAARVHVELATGLALMLSTKRVVTEVNSPLKGLEIWRDRARQEFEEAHGKQLRTLLEQFPEDRLYVHPVKLSQWSS